jgi:hypothetical protein
MNTRQQAELEAHRTTLCAESDDIYIASQDFHDRLEWFETQNCHILARKHDILEYERKHLEHALDPRGSSQPPSPPAANLTAIVQFDKYYRNFLTADSGWTPRSGIPFADIRPSAVARPPPGAPALAKDFQVGYDHIVESMRACPSGEGTIVLRPTGVIDPKKPEGFGFKVSHRVFVVSHPSFSQPVNMRLIETQKKDSDDDDDGIIGTWPVGPQAAPELENIKWTHRAIPIPAFNIAGQAIPPAHYATELRGATVSLKFHLKHWVIRNKHTFTADIESIQVLVAAPPPTPKKKGEPIRRTNNRSGDRDNAGGSSRTKVLWPWGKA